MEFRQLLYYINIVKERSFTKASDKLHVSQPALSKTVKLLEEEIGAQLLVRTNHQFEMTEIGEAVFDQGEKLIDDFENFTNKVKLLSDSTMGTIKVGIPPIIGTCLFPSFLSGFYETYPKIQVDFLEEGANIIQEKVMNEKVDVGIVILPVDEKHFDVVEIAEDINVLIVSKKHHLSNKKSVKIRDLKNESFFLLNETYTTYYNVISACEEAGFSPDILFKSLNWDFLIEMVNLGKGVTILPGPILNKYITNEVVKIPIEDEKLRWRIVAIVKKNKILSNVTRKFIDYMKENGKI